MPRITSVSVDFDQCLAIVAEGRLYHQERIGNKRPWKVVSLDGLAPKVLKSIHHAPDGRSLYAVCSDGTLWEHRPTGGNRYSVERTWMQVAFEEPVEP